ncbi:MAG TPA: hypothetical protein VFL62_05470 [Bradyrhizobium sp.]|nr:hypothetical protein [Bradyrhizobium sp.]
MSGAAELRLARLRRLPLRLRIAHLAALVRSGVAGSRPTAELRRLLAAQRAFRNGHRG